MRSTETESILIFIFAFRHQNWMACFAFTSDAIVCQVLLLSDLFLKFSCKSHMFHIPTYNSPPILKSGSATRGVSWHGLSKAIFLQSQKISILGGIILKKRKTTSLSLVHLTQSPTYHLLIFSFFFFTHPIKCDYGGKLECWRIRSYKYDTHNTMLSKRNASALKPPSKNVCHFGDYPF